MMSVTILQGNCLDTLKTLPAGSVQCVVTSPPYWGLRAYGTQPQVWLNRHELCQAHQWGDFIKISNREHDSGTDDGSTGRQRGEQQGRSAERGNTCLVCGAWRGELGLEPTPELYVEHLVQVFREVRRVLRDDGTLWLNLGDSYAGGGNYRGTNEDTLSDKQRSNRGAHGMDAIGRKEISVTCRIPKAIGLKPKDLCGIPWRVAFALQADGWYLRSDIIWHKPNPMPESVTDRPTKAHEYIFMLTKNSRYYYDHVAIFEPYTGPINRWGGQTQSSDTRKGRAYRDEVQHVGATSATRPGANLRPNEHGRNKRSVWTIPTKAYSGAHFAVFPPELVEPCIQAGTSEKGCCPACGAPWERAVEKHVAFTSGSGKAGNPPIGKNKGQPQTVSDDYDIRMGPQVATTTIGWHPTCACPHADPIPCTVLDPFSGSGTTGVVAVELRRDYIGCELNPDYIELTNKRFENVQILMAV